MSHPSKPLISVVSPVYKAEKIVSELVTQLSAALEKITDNFEIVLVDDRSPDDSWKQILEAAEREPRVKAVRLCRNFGQHIAITAGLTESSGDFVAIIDCDLQEDPQEIVRMYHEIQKGYDLVYSRRQNRASTSSRSVAAKLFHKTIRFLTDQLQTDYQEGTLTLLSRKVVEAFLLIPDRERHLLFILKWLGFNPGYIDIEHRERFEGESSYTWKKLLKHGIDGVVSHSTKLLTISVVFGFTFVGLSIIASIFLILFALLHGFKEGWASVIVLMIFCTGSILTSLGVVGLYIGKIFEQSKGRPLYLVSERTR